MDRKIFTKISSKNWEHPADKAALIALKQVPQLNDIIKQALGFVTDKSVRLLYLGSAVRVSSTQFSKIYKLHREACSILDAPYLPELYISQTPILNAGAVGVEKPFVVLTSSMVERLEEDEILAVIGHELGHCLSGHAFYKTLFYILLQLVDVVTTQFQIPLAYPVIMAIVAALREWDRKSELSADRASVLVTQKPEAVYSLLMKLAGGTLKGEMDINEFFRQAADYEKDGDVVDSVYKMLNIMWSTHPFPVLRLTELKSWIDCGAYGKVLDGEYVRTDQEDESGGSEFEEAASQYKEDLNKSEDPLGKVVNNVVKDINKSVEQASDFFNNLFKNK